MKHLHPTPWKESSRSLWATQQPSGPSADLGAPLPLELCSLLDEQLGRCLPLGILWILVSDVLHGCWWNPAGRVKSIPHDPGLFLWKVLDAFRIQSQKMPWIGLSSGPTHGRLSGIAHPGSCLGLRAFIPCSTPSALVLLRSMSHLSPSQLQFDSIKS